MACPIGIEPTTFSFGGNCTGSEVNDENHSKAPKNPEEVLNSMLSLIVDQCRSLAVIVADRCYNYATADDRERMMKINSATFSHEKYTYRIQ